MLNIGAWEFTMILVAALLLLGPQKLPEFARWIGRAMREIRKTTQDVQAAINLELEKEELSRIQEELSTNIDPQQMLSPPSQEAIPPFEGGENPFAKDADHKNGFYDEEFVCESERSTQNSTEPKARQDKSQNLMPTQDETETSIPVLEKENSSPKKDRHS